MSTRRALSRLRGADTAARKNELATVLTRLAKLLGHRDLLVEERAVLTQLHSRLKNFDAVGEYLKALELAVRVPYRNQLLSR